MYFTLNPYHAIVANIARRNFERVNHHDFDSILKDLTPDIHHRFGGSHALGGERTGRDAVARWLGRVGRLGKQLHIKVGDVWVSGWPWNTTVIVRWDSVDPSVIMSDGSTYMNHGVHIIRMKWGKVYDIDVNEDSQRVAENMKSQLAAGVEEAGAPPLT